ncbi:hypothetical protein [Nitrosomonas sp.]|uniref:hypothetical protein n=1 Tax=Nitrosomonas sp. TaxID=42353 RepID=UPI0037CAAFBC
MLGGLFKRSGPRYAGATGENIYTLIALSVSELRKLLSHLLWHASQAIEHVLH